MISVSNKSVASIDNNTVNFPFFHSHQHQNKSVAFFKDSPPNDYIKKENPNPNPSGISFLDEVGGIVDGLLSCTESLGFESTDERRVDDLIESLDEMEEMCLKKPSNSYFKHKVEKKVMKKMFPPPLSSLTQEGKPMSFFKSMRIDGRLKVTEVRINRPEILRSSRQDGRLRLDLITDYEEEDEEEEEDKEMDDNVKMPLEEMEEIMIKEKWQEEERAEIQRLSGGNGGGESLRRCYEELLKHHQNHHHHRRHQHNMHGGWRQQCVTTV